MTFEEKLHSLDVDDLYKKIMSIRIIESHGESFKDAVSGGANRVWTFIKKLIDSLLVFLKKISVVSISKNYEKNIDLLTMYHNYVDEINYNGVLANLVLLNDNLLDVQTLRRQLNYKEYIIGDDEDHYPLSVFDHRIAHLEDLTIIFTDRFKKAEIPKSAEDLGKFSDRSLSKATLGKYIEYGVESVSSRDLTDHINASISVLDSFKNIIEKFNPKKYKKTELVEFHKKNGEKILNDVKEVTNNFNKLKKLLDFMLPYNRDAINIWLKQNGLRNSFHKWENNSSEQKSSSESLVNKIMLNAFGEMKKTSIKKNAIELPNYNTMAEAYSYIMSDINVNKLHVLSVKHYVTMAVAKGEAEETIMAKVKSGRSGVVEVIKRLFKKLIAFIKEIWKYFTDKKRHFEKLVDEFNLYARKARDMGVTNEQFEWVDLSKVPNKIYKTNKYTVDRLKINHNRNHIKEQIINILEKGGSPEDLITAPNPSGGGKLVSAGVFKNRRESIEDSSYFIDDVNHIIKYFNRILGYCEDLHKFSEIVLDIILELQLTIGAKYLEDPEKLQKVRTGIPELTKYFAFSKKITDEIIKTETKDIKIYISIYKKAIKLYEKREG